MAEFQSFPVQRHANSRNQSDDSGKPHIAGTHVRHPRVVDYWHHNDCMAQSTFSERVYEQVCRIPRGSVATYGQIAALAGNPRNARVVGYALHGNPRPGIIPCHRVVFRDGSLAPGFAFGGPERQRELLEDEGVTFIPPKAGQAKSAGAEGWLVDLDRCQWTA